MFKWIKNHMLAKLQIEKFLSSQYVALIKQIQELLITDKSKEEIFNDLQYLADQVCKKYKLSATDISYSRLTNNVLSSDQDIVDEE